MNDYKGKLIIVRHGEYGDDDHLNNEGTCQIVGLAHILISDSAGCAISGKITILSSTAPRAKESAEILFHRLWAPSTSMEIELADVLWVGTDAPGKMDKEGVLRLIQEKADKQDVIIVVTHLNYAEGLPADFGIDFHGKVEKGEMLVINMATKSYHKYP